MHRVIAQLNVDKKCHKAFWMLRHCPNDSNDDDVHKRGTHPFFESKNIGHELRNSKGLLPMARLQLGTRDFGTLRIMVKKNCILS